MYYGFYAGELALQRMVIKCFPDQLGGRDPFDVGLFIVGLAYVRDVTERQDIGLHIAYVSKRAKETVPSIGLRVGEPTFIVGLFALEQDAYMNRITQEKVDLLAEMFETKPTWWEIEHLTDL
uniref:Protein kinase domain-containing protein n=1 Tax=Ganoderma boninense TaxID=34458 RepID=A0A5K1K8B0_9APHY|nr:Protein kinase domain-containing protein [Ganoderma boninense]